MKKNLSDILKNADPAELDGMFDTVKDKNSKNGKIKKAVLQNDNASEADTVTVKRDGAVLWPVLAVMLIVIAALIFIPAFVKPDTQNPASGLTAEITGTENSEKQTELCDTVESAVTSDNTKEKPNEPTIPTLYYLKDCDFLDRIIWSDSSSDELTAEINGTDTEKWNGLTVTKSFYDILEKSSDDALFAITVKTTTPGLRFENYLESYYPEYVPVYEEYNMNCAKWIYLQDWYNVVAHNRDNAVSVNGAKISIIGMFGEDFFYTYYHDGDYDYDLMKADIDRYQKLIYGEDGRGFRGLDVPDHAFKLQCSPDIRNVSFSHDYYTYYLNNRTYFMIFITKSELASLYDLTKENNRLSQFDFEHSCFTMIKYQNNIIDKAYNEKSGKGYTK